jgi:hypothetical protein
MQLISRVATVVRAMGLAIGQWEDRIYERTNQKNHLGGSLRVEMGEMCR